MATNSLADALRKSSRSTVVKRPATNADEERRSLIGGHFPLSAAKALRLAAKEDDRLVADILAEALNDWLAKTGRPEVFPRPERPEPGQKPRS